MPVNRKMSVGEIIQELLASWKQKGTIGTSKPKDAKAAARQAAAIAYRTKRGA